MSIALRELGIRLIGISALAFATAGCTEPLDVAPLPPNEILALRPAAAVLGVSQNLQIMYERSQAGAAAAPITRGITWKSEDARIATVDAAGMVTAVAPGMTNIVGTSRSGAIKAPVLVAPTAVASLQVRPATMALLLNGRGQVTVSGVLLDGGVVDLTQFAAWSADDPAVLSIDRGSVRALQYGATVIRITVAPGLSAILGVSVEDGRPDASPATP